MLRWVGVEIKKWAKKAPRISNVVLIYDAIKEFEYVYTNIFMKIQR